MKQLLLLHEKKKNQVDLEDFEVAVDRVIAGVETGTILSEEEKKLIAYHEAGHAVIGWFLEYADPILKVTIIPRGKGSLGFAQSLPNEIMLYHKDKMLDIICTALGGRAAEQVFFKRVSTGASDDLEKVSNIARKQVATFGMNQKLSNVDYDDNPNQFLKPFSDRTAQVIDEEIEKIIATAYERTLRLVETYKDKVVVLAEKLLEVETVSHDTIVEILGPRPFTPENYKQVIKHMNTAKDLQQETEKNQDKEEENQPKTDEDTESTQQKKL